MTRQFASIAKSFVVIGCLLLLASIAAVAQSQATSGNIEGRVTDPNGAAVPGVTVTATNQETGLAKSADSDSDGLYRIILLPPGKYKVATSNAKGFKISQYENVTVSVGGQSPLDIPLSVGGETMVVEVTTVDQLVETTRTSVSSTINERAIQNLPVNGPQLFGFCDAHSGRCARAHARGRLVGRWTEGNFQQFAG